MASRMERYYKTGERSKKNEDLYKQIGEFGSYTNIEGVVDISNSNEINIAKVKEMLKKRDEQQKNYSLKAVVDFNDEPSSSGIREEKTYDLKDVLDKAKTGHSDSDAKYRNLKNRQYEIIKNLQINNPENEELNELLNTLSLGGGVDDDLGIFDDLKSNTMVGEPSSIKKVLKEAKESEEKNDTVEVEQLNHTNLDNLDKSFYTASFKFSDKDFEDLRSLDSSLKKNNKLIKILIIIFSILLAAVVLIIIMKAIF